MKRYAGKIVLSVNGEQFSAGVLSARMSLERLCNLLGAPKVKRGRGGRRKRKALARARHVAAGGES